LIGKFELRFVSNGPPTLKNMVDITSGLPALGIGGSVYLSLGEELTPDCVQVRAKRSLGTAQNWGKYDNFYIGKID
jgi:hypothetical protein